MARDCAELRKQKKNYQIWQSPLAGRWLFRRRGGMILMRSAMLAPDRKNILMKQIKRVRRYLGTPLINLFLVPVSVKSKCGVSQVLRKREPISSFAQQDAADLTPCVHFVNPPRRTTAAVCKHQQHFAFFS